MKPEEIIKRAFEAFPKEAPRMTLRQGDALSSYRSINDIDPDIADDTSDSYLERYQDGIYHLDAQSWRSYLPFLISYSIRHIRSVGPSMVIDIFLSSIRPPDREPPRLATIQKEEKEVIVATLEFLAFSKDSEYENLALQVMEEYWIPNATYGK